MFQTFESQSERGAATERIKELRRLMAAAKLDAYLVPRADEYQGEYVPPSAARSIGSPGSPGPRAWPSSPRRPRRCSSTAATRCRRGPKSSRG